jgi:pyruvate formate lyase activating enzyme
MHEALIWNAEGDRIRCGLCPHACAIAEGRTGVCGVRRNAGGTLEAMTYARVTSVAVDPIEKKPVFHYRPGSLTLSLGSVGCTMRCQHCQNWQISRADSEDGALVDLPVEEVPALAKRHDCAGVAFTYNEPVIWAEYVLDVSTACRSEGLFTVMVTNGYITAEGLDLIGEVIDVWRVDVKGLDDVTYRSLCKVPSVAPVLEMAVRAQQRWGMHVEVVTNVVPGFNDSERSLRGIASWIASELGRDTPWHITRFYPYLELSSLSPTPIETLRRGREIGAEEGLHFVYLGNVAERGGEDTVCPECGGMAVRRVGYDVLETALDADGRCASCGTPLNISTRERRAGAGRCGADE